MGAAADAGPPHAAPFRLRLGLDGLALTKCAVALCVLLTEAAFLDAFAHARVEFALSSLLTTAAVLIQLRYGVRRGAATPADIIVFVFSWLFLDLAPKVQLIDVPRMLVNTSTVSADGVLLTNGICALFIVSFTGVYALLGRRRGAAPAGAAAAPAARSGPARFTAFGVAVAVAVSALVVLLAARYAYAADESLAASPSGLVINRFLLFLPSATLLILLNETVSGGKGWSFSRGCVLLLLALLLLITENPFTERRNALGPVYLCLILTAFPVFFRSQNRRFLLIVAGMVLVFPAITVFTHNHANIVAGVEWHVLWEQMEDHYSSINYDSWANVYTAVEIATRQGVEWGRQLLGSLLFFVPSSLWSAKPLATGIVIGKFLVANYSMWFTNLSAPLVAEGFLDFGYAGVVLYAAAVACLVDWLDRLARRSSNWLAAPFATYVAVFLMLLLRGSLMIAFAFGAAAALAFVCAFALLSIGRWHPGRRFYGAAEPASPAMRTKV